MARRETQTDWFPTEMHDRARGEIVGLGARLPPASVAELAREVLMRVAARGAAAPPPTAGIETDPDARLERLCAALISEDDRAGAEMIRTLSAEGATVEAVYLGPLANAARRLGEWWDEDRVSFAEVTIGTSRIYAILRALRHLSPPRHAGEGKAAMFASTPGEIHTLGVNMAADLFRREGWEIDLQAGCTHDALVETAERSGPRVVGLSAGGVHSADRLARLVVALRVACPWTLILVSGQIVEEAPDLVEAMHVDAMVDGIPAARAAMDALWTRSMAEHPPLPA